MAGDDITTDTRRERGGTNTPVALSMWTDNYSSFRRLEAVSSVRRYNRMREMKPQMGSQEEEKGPRGK